MELKAKYSSKLLNDIVKGLCTINFEIPVSKLYVKFYKDTVLLQQFSLIGALTSISDESYWAETPDWKEPNRATVHQY